MPGLVPSSAWNIATVMVGVQTTNAKVAAAQSNVRSAIPAAEAFYQDSAGGNGSYTGINNAALTLEAPGISPNVKATVLNGGAGYY